MSERLEKFALTWTVSSAFIMTAISLSSHEDSNSILDRVLPDSGIFSDHRSKIIAGLNIFTLIAATIALYSVYQ